MALLPHFSPATLISGLWGKPRVICRAAGHRSVSLVLAEQPPVVRRSANYHPTLWDTRFIESLTPYDEDTMESSKQRIEELKEKVKNMLSHANDPLQKMNFVDVIDRLGLDYHFDKEIEETIQHVHDDGHVDDDDLYAAALRFRLLRKQGYHVSCDVFNKYIDKDGKFMQSLRDDVQGLLSLYEASAHSLHGEDILDEALAFTTEHLKSIYIHLDPALSKRVEQALGLPPHWGLRRLETRQYISFYDRSRSRNDVLLELAKLDYNLIQSLHQSEIKEVSRWWKGLDVAKKLPYARDRVVECFTWGVDVNHLPKYSDGRVAVGKSFNMVSTIDDTYDVYGTLDELELFTAAIDRWDLGAMDQLPDYMKLCYLALYNFINEIEYMSLKTWGKSCLYYLRRAWGDYCKALMQEHRWFHSGYVPSMEEYLNVSTVTSTGFVNTLAGAVGMGDIIMKEGLDYVVEQSRLPWLSSAICRFVDDVGTSKDEHKRGDVAKSVHCYMKDHGVSEEEACVGVMRLRGEAWKTMNEELLNPIPLPKPLIQGVLSFARVSEMLYQNGVDGYGNSKSWTKERINSMFFEPFAM